MKGIIVAMDAEHRAVEDLGLDAVCMKSGVGKVNAARCATELILEHHPDCIINSGFAGALAPDLKVGDIVVGTEVASHDVWHGEGNVPGQVQGEPRRFGADQGLLEKARTVLSGAGVHFGLIVSGDQFFISREEDRRILSLYPDALASDMEASSIAQVCRHYGVPFLCVRTISDVHTSEEVQIDTYNDSLMHSEAAIFDFLKYFG